MSKLNHGKFISILGAVTFAVSLLQAPHVVAAPRGFVERYVMALQAVLKADADMYKHMELVSATIEEFYGVHGHFPKNDEEKAAFIKLIGSSIPCNPYQPKTTDLYSNKLVAPETAVPIHFLSAPNMTRDNVKQYMKTPPPTWQGDPGSIFVVTDNDHLYLIWAASADRLPMRDFTTSELKPRMIAKKVSLLNG